MLPRPRVLPLLSVLSVLPLLPACALRGPAPQGQTLHHRAAGVRLTLPATWQPGTFVTRARPGAGAGHPGAEYTLSVDYRPLARGAEPAPLLRLLVYPAQRGATDFDDPAGPGTVLVEAASRIYVLVLPREQPFREGSADAERYAAMRPSLAEIRKGLVILSGED